MTRFGVIGLLVASMVVAAPVEAQKRQRDVIRNDEIMASPQKESDLLSAIRALRPQFLEPPKGTRSIAGTFINPIVVYFGPLRQPGVESLRNVMAYDAEEVRYLDPSQSENRYGITANGGAIVVKIQARIAPKKDSTPPPDAR
jgi:hypothetical protein